MMQNWIDNSFQAEFEQESYFGSLGENSTNPSSGGDRYPEALIIRDITGKTSAIYFDITDDILENDPHQTILLSPIENDIWTEKDVIIDTYRYINELIFCDEKSQQKQKDRTEFIKKEQLQLISNRNPDHYRNLWNQCENCFIPNYKKVLKSNMQICEECGSYFKMTSSDRIDLLIDEGTWNPLDQDMVSLDSSEFDSEAELECYEDNIKEWNEEMCQAFMRKLSKDLKEGQALERTANLIEEPWLPEYIQPEEKVEEWTKPDLDEGEESQDEERWIWELDKGEESQEIEDSEANEEDDDDAPYVERLAFYKKETGLLDAVQTGVGQLNGRPVALGVMDFRFLAGSMGCVVGEKITRLIEYATNNLLPLIILSASGGARVHEGSLSLMQMAKISAALYDYQSNKRLFYISILTSPTTGGVTASFAMLGDIIITEPGTFVAFAGPRVVQQILNETIPEEEQEAEALFEKGFFDLIVPRHLLKNVISELLNLHAL
uniref:Acetyl-coenzyme A carboxylase carboxyl transferase subunit beta, chloroplastic n=3 Tax=Cuscuta subgen. Grammica TaxID=1824618 RepID=A0A7H0R1Q5_9ASTE|nr:acetyl-CoA carboxylase carboxyltransferase beta subunit [Cuscuta campestris]QNQ65354.1 acetyl-CoA carboxylase carboxyltransferase beta subunit [Cuscuta campestris]